MVPRARTGDYLDSPAVVGKSATVPNSTSQAITSIRGAKAGELQLEFVAGAPDGAWPQLFQQIGLVTDPLPSFHEEGWTVPVVALPDDLRPGSRYLSGEVHSHRTGGTHWYLTLTLIRGPNPPGALVEASRRVGGYPAILNRLATAWPLDKRTEVTFRATFLVEQAQWTSILALEKRTKRAVRRKGTGQAIAVLKAPISIWTIAAPGSVNEIMDMGPIETDWVGMSARGKVTVDLGPTFFERVESEAWTTLSKFLRPVKPRRTKSGSR